MRERGGGRSETKRNNKEKIKVKKNQKKESDAKIREVKRQDMKRRDGKCKKTTGMGYSEIDMPDGR